MAMPANLMDVPAYDNGTFAADLKEVDASQLTETLFLAIRNGQDDIVSLLTEKIDIKAVRHYGQTPLLAAVDAGQTRVVQRLMDYDCDINEFSETNLEGERVSMTPLMKAAHNGHLVLVKLLVEVYQADDSLVSPEGQTALRLAVTRRHREVAEYLPSRRGGGWRRLKFRNRKSIRRLKSTAHSILDLGKCMAEIPKALFWDLPQWLAKKIWKMIKGIPGFIRKLPERVQKVAKALLKLVKKIPGWTARFLRFCWRVLKAVPPAVWHFVTVILPEAIARFSRWLAGVVTRSAKAVANVIQRIVSVIHTALASFFSMATLQDIWNGIEQVLHALSPAKIWYALGKTWEGFLTFLEWCVKGSKTIIVCLVFSPIVIVVCLWKLLLMLGKQIIAIPANIGAMAARAVDEVHVWVNPKAGI